MKRCSACEMSIIILLSLSLFVLFCRATPLMKDDSILLNEIDDADTKGTQDPNTAMTGVYTDCLARFSFTCVQQKTLIFIDRLSRMDRIPILGNIISVIKIKGEDQFQTPLTEDVLTARHITDEATLKTLIDISIDRFFQTHVIRLQMPDIFREPPLERTTSDTSVDFIIGDSIEAEGRKKGGGKKGMKKMMMMMGMMMMTKLMMLAPLLMGVVGLAAIKALIFSVISITISKIMILKKLKSMMSGQKGGHGGGHDSSGSGGGWSSGSGGSSNSGWDRALSDGTGQYLAYRAYNTR